MSSLDWIVCDNCGDLLIYCQCKDTEVSTDDEEYYMNDDIVQIIRDKDYN